MKLIWEIKFTGKLKVQIPVAKQNKTFVIKNHFLRKLARFDQGSISRFFDIGKIRLRFDFKIRLRFDFKIR